MMEPVREIVGGETYEYYPIGAHVVSAPEVCGGRPTFKYTRVEVAGILRLLGLGWTVDRVVEEYGRPELSPEALREAIGLAADALLADWPGWAREAA